MARLRELESFKRVVAPFDGVITARNTDIGALINAGQSTGAELFRVADTHKLRIYVQVPELFAAVTKPGLEAELRFSGHPNQTFFAKTVRTSNALDPVLRTLQVELELDNAQGEILPGAYAEVHFKLPVNAATLRLPANTVLFRSAGLQVATFDSEKRIKLKSIVQGRDFGSTIEVLSGIDARRRRRGQSAGLDCRWRPGAHRHRRRTATDTSTAGRQRTLAGAQRSLWPSERCSFAPAYKTPDSPPPTPHTRKAGDWKPAQPSDAQGRGAWWSIFHDPQLDALEAQVADANQDLKAAFARLQQARAQRASHEPTCFRRSPWVLRDALAILAVTPRNFRRAEPDRQ